MGKTQMGDVIVIVPGITGSILQKNGQDLWALSGEALWASALAKNYPLLLV